MASSVHVTRRPLHRGRARRFPDTAAPAPARRAAPQRAIFGLDASAFPFACSPHLLPHCHPIARPSMLSHALIRGINATSHERRTRHTRDGTFPPLPASRSHEIREGASRLQPPHSPPSSAHQIRLPTGIYPPGVAHVLAPPASRR